MNDVLDKSNYRPVSVLIAMSKIYEKAVSIQVTNPLTLYFKPYFLLFVNMIIVKQSF